ncbi:MAG: hypothetical protein Q7T11_04880 [Deltaproteobacteria bacterium]|nr:hypothetical protein [Deltaproteobacteria bacterium]
MQIKNLIFLGVFVFAHPGQAVAGSQSATKTEFSKKSAKPAKSKIKAKKIEWTTHFNNKVSEMLRRPGAREALRPVPAYRQNEIRPFQERLFIEYGQAVLSNNQATERRTIHRILSWLQTLPPQGVALLDELFASYLSQASAEGVRAFINPALQVSEYFFHTGYTRVQRQLHSNPARYNTLLRGERNRRFYSINHNDAGSILEFTSAGLRGRMVTAVSNRNGQLGFGFCSLSQMAHHDGRGLCNVGFDDERLQCLAGAAGETPGVGGSGSSSGEAGASSPAPSAPEATIAEIVANRAMPGGSSAMIDPFNGLSEAELRAIACGFVTSDALQGMMGGVGSLDPSSQCMRQFMGAIQAAQPEDPMQRTMACYDEHYGDQNMNNIWSVVRIDRGGEGLNGGEDCQLLGGNGIVGPSSVTYHTRRVLEFGNERETRIVNVDVIVRVDHEDDYQISMSGTATNPETGRSFVVDMERSNHEGLVAASFGMNGTDGSTSVSGNLGSDRDQNQRRATMYMDEARDHGQVTRPRNCVEGEVCNQSEVDQANSNEGARAAEQRRRTEARNNGGGGSGSDPGPDSVDRCSAEGRRIEALVNCVMNTEEETRRRAEAMTSNDPWINPGPDGIPQPEAGMFGALGCLVQGAGTGLGPTVNKAEPDRCFTGDEPGCFDGGGGGSVPAAIWDGTYGHIDPEGEEEDPCRQIVIGGLGNEEGTMPAGCETTGGTPGGGPAPTPID